MQYRKNEHKILSKTAQKLSIFIWYVDFLIE